MVSRGHEVVGAGLTPGASRRRGGFDTRPYIDVIRFDASP